MIGIGGDAMKLISFVSWKGGAGKTTALMAISSALVDMGYRVLLIEADDNEPLIRWRSNAAEKGHWHDNIDVVRGDDLDTFEAAVTEAERARIDFVLADTAGGGSELNVTVIANSDLAIVPTSLGILDLDEAISTLEFIDEEVSAGAGREVQARLLLTRYPQSQRLKSTQEANLRDVEELPRLGPHLTERAAFTDLKLNGLLGPYYASVMRNKANRLRGPHILAAFEEARQVTAEIIEATQGDRR